MSGLEDVRIRPVTENELRSYLIAKGTSDKCFSCGTDQWFLDSGENDIYRGIPWADAGEGRSLVYLDERTSAMAVVLMTCQNCGFVRMHDLYMILLWLHYNPVDTQG